LDPQPDVDCWLIISATAQAQPIDFTPYGMPGCWLHVSLDDLVYVPVGYSKPGMIERIGGRIMLTWTPPMSFLGRSVWMQMLVSFPGLNQAGFLSSHAIEVRVGS